MHVTGILLPQKTNTATISHLSIQIGRDQIIPPCTKRVWCPNHGNGIRFIATLGAVGLCDCAGRLVLLATAADHEDADKDPNATPIMTHKRRGAERFGSVLMERD